MLIPGLLLAIIATATLLPSVLESVNGPRFDTPGSRVLELDQGTWVLFELTTTTTGGGGFTSTRAHGISVAPDDVTVTGPAPVHPTSHLSSHSRETISRGRFTYTGAVRFEIEQAGAYEIRVDSPRHGEVIVSRPIADTFSDWPLFVAGALGGLATLVGAVMWIVGANNRRIARRASVESS